MKNLFFVFFLFLIVKISGQTLHIYGGENHDVYLGCLNCIEYDSESIWNEYGTYGNEYNSYSPWIVYSNKAAVIVNKSGDFYGYFTLNEYHSKRADFGLVLTIYKYYDLIRDDVVGWYKFFFIRIVSIITKVTVCFNYFFGYSA